MRKKIERKYEKKKFFFFLINVFAEPKIKFPCCVNQNESNKSMEEMKEITFISHIVSHILLLVAPNIIRINYEIDEIWSNLWRILERGKIQTRRLHFLFIYILYVKYFLKFDILFEEEEEKLSENEKKYSHHTSRILFK